MQIPYIRIKQRSEIFYIVKFDAKILINNLNFHFREPYSDFQKDDVIIKNNKYIEEVRKKGIDIQSDEEGIQRRLQIDRINSIKSYIESDVTNFLPNTVLISADISNNKELEEQIINAENEELGIFEFPNSFYFNIIDGQHRLGGLSLLNSELLDEFEIPAIILFNISLETAAKLFADINGKQKAVNKSLIYDLYSQIDSKKHNEISKFHNICNLLYKEIKSPLYRQIKMLGVGSGSISQAFFIDYAKDAINKTNLKDASTQEIFNYLFWYFNAYQLNFPNDWTVPLNFTSNKEIDEHSNFVLKTRKSQLLKTNGFGAIMRAFPHLVKLVKDPKEFNGLISKQVNKINWVPSENSGTGKALQNSLYKNILNIYNL